MTTIEPGFIGGRFRPARPLDLPEARRRSPAIWGLMGAGVAAVVVLGYTVAVNAYDHRADIIRWLKF